MLGRPKLLILIPALILIPILLGMTPLKMVQKIGDGCPFSQGKQVLNCNPCPFHSIISQEDHGIVSQPSMLFNEASADLPGFEVLNSISITSNNPLSVVPLRC
jgi:hypothetical protein